MATDIWKIPLDSDGAVRGSYYLRHHSQVTDTLGTVQFDNGRSVEPVTGRQLFTFVAALGADVDLEPADDAARAAMGAPAPLPEPVAPPEPDVVFVPDTEPAPRPTMFERQTTLERAEASEEEFADSQQGKRSKHKR